MLGLPEPAMSITGSGAHGIIATMPLYAAYKVNGYSEEKLLRATALSYLICMYIKEYSGKLSAFCGCAIAAGTGMACGLVFLRDGTTEMMARTIDNMASSITGMICDGGNQGCAMKGVVAVDAAYRSAAMAMKGVFIIYPVHGINGRTPEETMRIHGADSPPPAWWGRRRRLWRFCRRSKGKSGGLEEGNHVDRKHKDVLVFLEILRVNQIFFQNTR